MYILQRSHAYSWHRQKVCTSTLPTGIRCLGKARLILLATAPGDLIPNVWTWGAHPESVPGRVCAPSANVYLRTTADRSMYYYRTRTHRWLAMPKLSDHRPSSIHCGVYLRWTFGTFTTRVGDFFRQNCRLGVLFLGRLAN